MKKQLNSKKLQLNKETVSHLAVMSSTGGSDDWKGISRAFTNCTYCSDLCQTHVAPKGAYCI